MRSLKTIQLEMEKDRFMDHRSKLVARREGNNSCTRMKYRDTPCHLHGEERRSNLIRGNSIVERKGRGNRHRV